MNLWVVCLSIGYGVMVNGAAYAAFRYDKRQAQAGGWRVSERALLFVALLGGWVGAKLAQRRFRHKTRKHPFATLLNLVPVVQAFVVSVWQWPRAWTGVIALLPLV